MASRICLSPIRGFSIQNATHSGHPRGPYPERFAQEALGHNSKAVHRAYARKAQVVVPPLSAYETQQATDLSREIRFPSPVPANPPLNVPSSAVAFTS